MFKELWQIKLKRPTRRGHVFGPAMGEAGVRNPKTGLVHLIVCSENPTDQIIS